MLNIAGRHLAAEPLDAAKAYSVKPQRARVDRCIHTYIERERERVYTNDPKALP